MRSFIKRHATPLRWTLYLFTCLFIGVWTATAIEHFTGDENLIIPLALWTWNVTYYVRWSYSAHVNSLPKPEPVTPHYTCPLCGATSYNENDIKYSYCGRCHEYGRG